MLQPKKTKFRRMQKGRMKMERALLSLGARELEVMKAEQEQVEVGCHFCNKKYYFTQKDLEKMIREAKK